MSEPAAAPSPAPSSPSSPPAAPVPSGKRPRGFETPGDMLRTMLFVLALVLVVFFLTARPQGDQRPPADVAATSASATAAGVPVGVPVLPEGWKASNSRFGPDAAEGLPTFHVGYLDPAGAYGGITATAAATPGWVEGVAGEDATADGTRELAGRTWEVWTRADPRSTTLVSDPSSSGGGPALAVTSRGDDADLQTLAQAAVAAVSSATGASSPASSPATAQG
ncbi:DUF4245 domain-containing protein [Streptomyces sp. NP160]|uniref:DUF4245 family protein n=1 Tax=Streptomyces sp. NP160 TaxID=2586637 RepID=UPI0011184749|nr:DUF4245 family protein [Streptomyces sp. NP160]TNM67482.1 DUF4245 domain-containing protein [Streptomyces sp. NP160]